MTQISPLRHAPEPARTRTERTDALRAALREEFLTSAGWDPNGEVFAPQRDHPLLGLRANVSSAALQGCEPRTWTCARYASSGSKSAASPWKSSPHDPAERRLSGRSRAESANASGDSVPRSGGLRI